MLVPLSWLRDYVAVTLSPTQLAEELTLRGMEVRAIDTAGADWSGVVVGRLLGVERHPNAEKLWLTFVDVGGGEPLQVVCGADNIAVGQLVPVALVGAVLPGERRIERTRIRGVESRGMLCSAAELQTGGDAVGIQILGTAEEFPLGTDLREVFGEVVLDIDVKPNRGDALSMIGLAREIAALSGEAYRWPGAPAPPAIQDKANAAITVAVEDDGDCPRFTALLFDSVNNGPSPTWMQRRLLAAGMRPISAVVDITNYVMHELGQPMHAYDADAVPDGQFVVRRAVEGERLITIDHGERVLDPRMLVIAGTGGPLGLAGIMGGAASEVTGATTRVIFESAIFDGPTVRNTARRLGLRSEASMRHEKGIPHDLPPLAAQRAAALLTELTGARLQAVTDSKPLPELARRIEVDLGRTRRLLGFPVDAAGATALLEPLGFTVQTLGGDALAVTVPWFRTDVIAAEDVAEEIARSHGYGRIDGRLPAAALPAFRPDPSEPRHRIRRILTGLGLDEVVTHALIGADDLIRSGADPADGALVRVANPLSEDHAILRPSLYASLLSAMAENVRQRLLDPWIFEIGKAYRASSSPELGPAESAGTGRFEAWQIGIGLLGPRTARSIHSDPLPADVAELKGLVEALVISFCGAAPTFRESASSGLAHLHPGRQAELILRGGHAAGIVGEVAPAVAQAWDLPGRPVVAIVRVADLLSSIDTGGAVVVPPQVQPVDRDLAVVVADSIPVGEVLRLVRDNGGPRLVEVRLFDEYRGPQIGAGHVSYAIALRFQPQGDEERVVERAVKRIGGALTHHLSATIR